MSNLKICPKCLFVPNQRDPIDILECKYCHTKLIVTNIPENKRAQKIYSLQAKYEKLPQYDHEAWLYYTTCRTKEISDSNNPTPTLTTCPVCGGKLSTAATACPHCGQPMSNGQIAPSQTAQKPVVQQPTVPRCPTCQSTNISKIGYFDRVTSVAFWGLASRKMGKQFSCDDCGYKW